MLYPVEIEAPFSDQYGSKKRFRMPQKIEKVKSLTISVLDKVALESKIAPLPVEIKFDLFIFSLMLNNANDEVIADAPCQYSLFQVFSDWNNIYNTFSKECLYNRQKVVINKKIIKNSVHYAVFKMPEDIISYGATNAATQLFIDYLRSDDFKLILYIESA